MKTVSMAEFRREAKRWLDAVRRGERILLTYRGRPLAHIEPVRTDARAIADDDPLLQIDDFAVDGRGGALTNPEIDRIVYGA